MSQDVPRTAICKHCGHNSGQHRMMEPRLCNGSELRPPFPRVLKLKRDCRKCPGFECDHAWVKAPFSDYIICTNCRQYMTNEHGVIIEAPYGVSASGIPLTKENVERMADKAERGYG